MLCEVACMQPHPVPYHASRILNSLAQSFRFFSSLVRLFARVPDHVLITLSQLIIYPFVPSPCSAARWMPKLLAGNIETLSGFSRRTSRRLEVENVSRSPISELDCGVLYLIMGMCRSKRQSIPLSKTQRSKSPARRARHGLRTTPQAI